MRETRQRASRDAGHRDFVRPVPVLLSLPCSHSTVTGRPLASMERRHGSRGIGHRGNPGPAQSCYPAGSCRRPNGQRLGTTFRWHLRTHDAKSFQWLIQRRLHLRYLSDPLLHGLRQRPHNSSHPFPGRSGHHHQRSLVRRRHGRHQQYQHERQQSHHRQL